MRRPQFTIRALLILMFGAACFFGGIRFERERRRREAMIDIRLTPMPAPAYQLPFPSASADEDSPTPTFVSESLETTVPKAPTTVSK